MMFKRSSNIPQRNKFCLTRQQILDDIEAVYKSDDQRNKLYLCLDQKSPNQEHRFDKIEEFLKGTQDLERSSNMLHSLKCELEDLEKDITTRAAVLRANAQNFPKTN